MDLKEISYSKALSRFNHLPTSMPIESVKNVVGDQTPVIQLLDQSKEMTKRKRPKESITGLAKPSLSPQSI